MNLKISGVYSPLVFRLGTFNSIVVECYNDLIFRLIIIQVQGSLRLDSHGLTNGKVGTGTLVILCYTGRGCVDSDLGAVSTCVTVHWIISLPKS